MKSILVLATSAVLVACGGGGSSSSPTTNLPITVVDGPIKNATVCLDKNNNSLCDADEPTGKTDVSGKVTLSVDTADSGKYPVIAIVGADAVDADTGAVPVPFTMKAPADQTAFVSPLTTLVQNIIQSTGASSADAESQVKAQTGVNISLFEDFTKGSSVHYTAAATLARMVVLTTQQQAEAVKTTIGTTGSDNATITKTDLNKAVQQRVLEMLPALLTAVQDTSVQNAATPAAKEAALLIQANLLLTTNGLTTSTVKTMVAINNQTSSSSTSTTSTPVASASLSSFIYNSATDWFMRIMSGTAAQNTPATDGSYRYHETHTAKVESGPVTSWGSGGGKPYRGADMHWNGSIWRTCPINFENTQTARNADGISNYDYCDKLETGAGQRAATFDLTDRKMIDVYNETIAAGYTNMSIASAASALGASTFPSGSKLFYSTGTSLANAIAYYPGPVNQVHLPDAALAAGDANACTALPSASPATTLEDLIARLKGTPCVNSASSVTNSANTVLRSGSRNDAWGYSSLNLGTIGNAPSFLSAANATSWYTNNIHLNVAFGSANTANYFSCQESFSGETRNCNLIGTGTYAIQTLGDARTLSFSGLPAIASNINYTRVFVERDRKVYFGYQDRPSVSKSARLNLTGSNALFSALTLPAFSPDVPVALSLPSYAGTYKGTFSGSDSGTTQVTISTSGAVTCSGTSLASGAFSCTFSLTPNSADTTTAAISMGITGNGASFSGTGNFYTGAITGTWTSGLASGTFVANRQ